MKTIFLILNLTFGLTLNAQSIQSEGIKTKLDSSLIGQRLDSAIYNLNQTITEFRSFTEPPLIIRGVRGMTNDSSYVTFFIDRTVQTDFETIWEKPIIGIAWVDRNGNKYHYGKGVLFYDLTHPYLNK